MCIRDSGDSGRRRRAAEDLVATLAGQTALPPHPADAHHLDPVAQSVVHEQPRRLSVVLDDEPTERFGDRLAHDAAAYQQSAAAVDDAASRHERNACMIYSARVLQSVHITQTYV